MCWKLYDLERNGLLLEHNDLSYKLCVPKKTKDLKLSMFNMITWINKSKALIKHISCACKYKFDRRKCNSVQWWNNNKCWCESKKHHVCKKYYTWNPATCSCKNSKYLASITDNSMITWDEIAEDKSYSNNFLWKKCNL